MFDSNELERFSIMLEDELDLQTDFIRVVIVSILVMIVLLTTYFPLIVFFFLSSSSSWSAEFKDCLSSDISAELTPDCFDSVSRMLLMSFT